MTRPLDAADRPRRTPLRGVPAARLARALVKTGTTLDPLARIAIYNRMYWFRLLDSFAEDVPGLRALLGEARFWALARAYLIHRPSRSYTLRNLCARLPAFLRSVPAHSRPHTAAAVDLARYEWAQIVAFDGGSRPRLAPAVIRRTPPTLLRVRLQPHVTLLTLNHAVDEYWHAMKRHGTLRATASQAVTRHRSGGRPAVASGRPGRQRVHLAVHRHEQRIYTKRLDPVAAGILRALARGDTLADACLRGAWAFPGDAAGRSRALRRWFQEWMQLGWLCAR